MEVTLSKIEAAVLSSKKMSEDSEIIYQAVLSEFVLPKHKSFEQLHQFQLFPFVRKWREGRSEGRGENQEDLVLNSNELEIVHYEEI